MTEELAIDGGAPVRSSPFPAWPEHDEEERKNLLRALESGQWWRVSGSEVNAFEEEFAAFHGAQSALAVSSGTQAIEVALMALGVGPGDEVIVPAFTFISTSMAVQRVGATPVPVDVLGADYNLDVAAVAEAITPRTRVVMPVHMAGHVVDMPALTALLEGTGIALLQDAAHANGAASHGKRLGEWATLACFSFQNFKLMAAGEGGLITFPDPELRERAFLHHSCGRSATDKSYDHQVLGTNCRMNEFSAAVLRAQLGRLEQRNELRERNASLLDERLAGIAGVTPQARHPWVDVHPHYMSMFRIDRDVLPEVDRDLVVSALVAEGIPAFIDYKPIYRTRAFWVPPAPEVREDELVELCPQTERLGRDGIWLHHRVLLGGEQEIADTAAAIEKVLRLAPRSAHASA